MGSLVVMARNANRSGATGTSGTRSPWWNKVSRSTSELDADELRQRAGALGATPVAECVLGERCTVAGVLNSVTLRPRQGVPAVVAELYDGSGTVLLVWLGRRRIAGIDPGRSLSAHGRINKRAGSRVMFNPRYALMRSSDD
jgi:hypothetical protein